MKKILLRLMLLATVLLAPQVQAESLTIAAASSLRGAMNALTEQYVRENPAVSPTLVYGASGRLATQVLHGAPFDLFFSADMQQPNRVFEQGMASAAPVPYARGALVLWSASLPAEQLSLERLADPGIRRIAIAQPAHAPYGERAVEAMRKAGIWSQVEHKLVYGENVSHAAQMAYSGAADVGLIALALVHLPELGERGYRLLDERLHSPLQQGFVITSHGEDKPAARDFARWISSKEAQQILEKYGFLSPAETGH